jgi:hypothetical protein
MFMRVVQKDDEVLVIGQKTEDQSLSNAMRSPRVMKRYKKTVFKPEMAQQFCRRQGHKLIGGVQ